MNSDPVDLQAVNHIGLLSLANWLAVQWVMLLSWPG